LCAGSPGLCDLADIVVVARALPDVETGVTPAAEVHRVAHLIIRESPDLARKGTLIPSAMPCC